MSSTTTLAECDTGGRKIEATAPFPPTSHLEMIAEDTNVVFPMEAFPEMSSTGSEKHNGRRCHDVDDSLTAAATLLIGGSVVLPVSSPNHKSASEALSNYQYDGPDATDLSSDERPLGESRALEEPGRKYLMEIVIAPKEIVVDDPEPSRFIVREEKTTLSILESVSAVLPTIAHVASSSDSVMSQVREEIVATINSDEVLPEREPACDGSLITEISTVYTSVSEDLNNVKHALLLDSTSQNGMTILETVEKVEAEIDSVKKELAQISEELSGDVGLEITLIHQARVLGLDSPYMREDTTEFLPCSVDARVVYPSSSQSSPTAVYITLEKSSERDHSSTPALLRRESKLTRLPEKDVLELVSEGSQPKSASFENDYDAKYLIGAWSGNISRRLGSEEPKCSANQFCYGVATVGSSPHELNEGRIKSLLMENKEKARLSVVPFEHLLPRSFPGTVDQQSYQSPIQTPVWQHNVEKHKHIHVTLLEKIAERRQFLKFKELVLTLRYRALMEAWRGEQKELSARRNLPKSVGRWDNEGCSDHALSSQRFPLQFRPLSLDGLDADSDAAQAMKMLMKNPHLEALRSALKMPAMFMDDKERVVHRFVSRNALVEDPIALEKERKTLNLWTTEERKVFTEKFAVYNKNFKVIASYLQLKTTADCVEYYYRNKKTEEFEKSSYGLQLKNRWDYTKSSSAFLAPTPSRIERNHEPTCDRIDALNAANMNMNPSQSNSQLEVSERANLSCGYFLMPSNVEMPKFLLEEKKALEVILPFGATTERAMSSLISTPCSVSSTAAHLTDDCKENDSVKKRLTDMPSITRSSYSEQHPAIAKVTRSTHFRRMSSRAATQEDSQWTDAERHLFTSAVAAHGKDFRVIASNVGTKSQSQCKSFFSKTRKRLCLDELVEQFQANEAAAMLVQSLRHYGCLEREVKPLSTSEIDATAGDIVEDLIDTAAAVSTLESFKGHSKCLSIDVSDLTLVADAAAVMEELTLVKPEVPSLDLFLSGKSRTSSHDLAFELVKVNQSNTNVLFTLSRKEEDEDSEATKSDGCYLVGTEAETDIVVDQAAAALIGMSAMLEDKSGLKRTKSEAKLDAKSSPVGVFSLSQSARLPTSSPPLYAVTPENLCLISGGTSRNVIERGNVTIPCKATTMDRPQDLYDAQTSRKFREMAGGESKPRREPTSWTQEEKEKFAIILREHGKDWSLLHDNLPSKSLTQIKTYFQNSKARSRLSASDKHLTVVQNDGANRKRKADEFELTRGSVELASSVKQKFRGNVDFPDLDSVTQKDDSQFGSAPVSGTVSVGIDILSHVVRLGNFAGQPADRASSSICQMVSANTYSQSCIQDGPEVFRPGPKPALPFSEGSRLCTPGSMQQLLSSPGSSRPVSLDPEALSLGVVSLGGPPPAIHKVAQQMQQMLEEQKQLQKQLNLLIQQQAALPPQLLPQHHQVSQQTLQAGRPLEEKLHQVVQQLQQQYELQGQGQIPCQEEGRSYSSHFQHQQTTPRRGILKVKPIRGVVSKPLVDLSTSLSLRDFSNQAKSQNDIIELRQQHHTLSLGIRAIPIVTAGSTAVVQENHTKMVELQDSDFYTDCEVMGSSVMVTEDAHQQTSIVHSTSSGQQQNTTPSTTSTLSSDSEHMKSRDVKLFGQSLLSKPPSVLSSSPCSAESLARDF
ncbi:hypothetical protein KC19_VG137600 [Ceratodon purpureus]|nr:hypothetical protein KC19_VG137600 [Ceratodon purpureus]